MTTLKHVGARASQEWLAALDQIVPEGQSRAAYILEAVMQRAEREGHVLPQPATPWGVRHDYLERELEAQQATRPRRGG